MELEGRTMLSVPDHDPSKKHEFGVMISFKYEESQLSPEPPSLSLRLVSRNHVGGYNHFVHPSDKRHNF
jgi:valyl-tRNA synthetase